MSKGACGLEVALHGRSRKYDWRERRASGAALGGRGWCLWGELSFKRARLSSEENGKTRAVGRPGFIEALALGLPLKCGLRCP